MKSNSGWCRFAFCENFKVCVKTRPPLVIFTAGIFILALGFIALAVYVQDKEKIPDPNYVTVGLSIQLLNRTQFICLLDL